MLHAPPIDLHSFTVCLDTGLLEGGVASAHQGLITRVKHDLTTLQQATTETASTEGPMTYLPQVVEAMLDVSNVFRRSLLGVV